MKVCCVDGQQLNVDLRNLRKAHGSTASARFTPDPKPDFGCAGKIDGTDSDDVGVLTVTFTPTGKAEVMQFSRTFPAARKSAATELSFTVLASRTACN